MKFADIKPFTRSGSYVVTIPWMSLERTISEFQEQGLDIDPDFQRGHVWTEIQQTRYVEYILRNGKSGREILSNHPGWHRSAITGPFVLVDGKQRIEAVRAFLRGNIPAFGYTFDQYEDSPHTLDHSFQWRVNDLQTRAEVLQWYIDLNSGGVVHTEDEIERVKKLLEQEQH